jgi:hypothetical protein
VKDIYGQYVPQEPPPIRKNGYVPINGVNRSNVEYIHDVAASMEPPSTNPCSSGHW